MKKKQSKSRIMTVTMLVVFGLGMMLAVLGLAGSVTNIDSIEISRTPEAVLASAGLTSGADISLPVVYVDQRSDACVNLYDASASEALKERQFEWTSCGYNHKQVERGLVGHELGEDYLPVAMGGKMVPNRGLTDMNRWFGSVEGKSQEYTGSLRLSYKTENGAQFAYVSNDFYPLDEAEFSVGDVVNQDGHNHLFTMNFAVPFTVAASGEESFEISADDDTFVYVGTELAIDMGGIHETTTGKMAINKAGEVYTATENEELAYSGIKLSEGEGSIIRIFHADRDADGSVFKVKINGMSLNVVQTQLASGSNGVQVAYDPSDPGYVGPLGESSVFRPDGTRGYIIMATMFSIVIVACAVFAVIAARRLFRD